MLDHVCEYRNREFAGIGQVLAAYLASIASQERPDAAFLAIAAPIRNDEVRMTNIRWNFQASGLARELALRQVVLLNDFAAQAHALPRLSASDLVAVGGGSAREEDPRVILGPGTGLGTAGLVYAGGQWHAIPGEGGHVTMAPVNEREERIVALVRARHGHCSAERLLSGPGLAFIHAALTGGTELAPEEVGARIMAGEATALEALDIFFDCLGTVAGNLALTFGAFGGVYIGGGIVPRYVGRFLESGFRRRFEAKGRYQPLMADIPTWLITAKNPALVGLASLAGATAES